MITPTAWAAGPVTITEPSGGLADVVTWQLVDPATAAVVASGGVDSTSSTTVMITPSPGIAADTYTVRLRDGGGVLVWEQVEALAVITAPPPDVPDGVSLTWIDGWGAVRFTAAGMGAADTVKLIGPGGVLVPIRGYETADWHAGSNVGYGYSFEMPLGVGVRFGICAVSAVTWAGGMEATITTPSGRSWLRDLHQPLLSLEVQVHSTGDEAREARQTVHRVVGRPNPIIRWDVRSGRAGTITLRVDNGTSTGWVTTARQRLDMLLQSGRPLLLSVPAVYDFAPCYLAVGSYKTTRLGKRARWQCDLDYVEVDSPATSAVVPAEVTYAEAAQIPPGATYADWAEVRYIDIATRRSL